MIDPKASELLSSVHSENVCFAFVLSGNVIY